MPKEPAPTVFQCGVPKSGNFWLYSAIQRLLLAAGREPGSFIQNQPIYQEAQSWTLSFPEQASIDVLDVRPKGYFARISSRFEQEITDLDAYLAQATHVWSHSRYRGELSDDLFSRVDCVIYIVRDPRDVLLSMTDFVFTPYMRRHFPNAHSDRASYLAERIETFPQQWAGHVNGYLDADPALGIRVLSYEAMKRDLGVALSQIAGWLSLDTLTRADISELAHALSFDAMRGSRPGHINRGQAERWRMGLSADQNAKIVDAAGDVLMRMGYAAE